MTTNNDGTMEADDYVYFQVVCECGHTIPAVHDKVNKTKFHVECPKCGWSDTLTAKIEELPKDLGGTAE